MKRTISTATLLALALPALAGGHEGGYDYAEVRSAVPRYEKVSSPQEECWTERVSDTGYRSAAPAPNGYIGPIIGGLAGGLLGSTIGKGSGNKWAIGAGAVTGAIVGSSVSRNNAYAYGPAQPQEVRRCKVVDRWEQRLSGYDVAYQYGGRTYSAVLPYDPGPRLRVRVAVEPAD